MKCPGMTGIEAVYSHVLCLDASKYFVDFKDDEVGAFAPRRFGDGLRTA